jgi:hypothetical protein
VDVPLPRLECKAPINLLFLLLFIVCSRGSVIEGFQRTYKFGSILGGSEEIMADLGVRMAMKQYPKDAKL